MDRTHARRTAPATHLSSEATRTRIDPLPATGNGADLQSMIDEARQRTGGASNIFLTLARHPRLLKRYLPFAHQILIAGTLPARDRELAILRTSWRCNCQYEWVQHTRIALGVGVTADEIEMIRIGSVESWPAWEGCLLDATDSLIASHTLSDATWASLAERYDDAALIEFTLMVGHYAMLAGMLNAVGVPTEDGSDG